MNFRILICGGLTVLTFSLATGSSAQPEAVRVADHAADVVPATLSLADARRLALQHSAHLAAAGREIQALDAVTLQTRLRPNPELGVTTENFGNRRLSGLDGPATTVQVSQPIELGDKRPARVRAAELAREVGTADFRAARREVLTRVGADFADALAAQERQSLTRESLTLADEVAVTVAKRVRAGRASPVEETRARLAAATARIELDQAGRALDGARRRLVANWSGSSAAFALSAAEPAPAESPPTDALVQRLGAHPAVARWSLEAARRDAVVAVERARQTPDVTVSAGVRRFHDAGEQAYQVGVSFPLPLFNRNQGAVLEAAWRAEQARDEQRAAQARLAGELASVIARRAAAVDELATLDGSVLPAARSAFDATVKGYEFGKFGYLDVLDAQRTLIEARARQVRARSDYRRAAAEIEWLTADDSADLPSPSHPGEAK